ncbi:hypothetical protein CRYUN_Cryun39dG0075700 [Craigia yunnanensis]
MAKEVDGFTFEQRHGKARVRVGRVWRSKEGGRHFMVEWNVNINLLSNCIAAYVRDDNSDIVATNTMKNTVYVKAKERTEQLSARGVCNSSWKAPHIILSTAEAIVQKSGVLQLTSGIEGLALLKTTKDITLKCSPIGSRMK